MSQYVTTAGKTPIMPGKFRDIGVVAILAIVGVSRVNGAEPVATHQDQPTFTKDVAPILQRSCENCHRPGQIGPFSMLTYEDTRPWAKAMKRQVVERNMPPWFIDRSVGIHKVACSARRPVAS